MLSSDLISVLILLLFEPRIRLKIWTQKQAQNLNSYLPPKFRKKISASSSSCWSGKNAELTQLNFVTCAGSHCVCVSLNSEAIFFLFGFLSLFWIFVFIWIEKLIFDNFYNVVWEKKRDLISELYQNLSLLSFRFSMAKTQKNIEFKSKWSDLKLFIEG